MKVCVCQGERWRCSIQEILQKIKQECQEACGRDGRDVAFKKHSSFFHRSMKDRESKAGRTACQLVKLECGMKLKGWSTKRASGTHTHRLLALSSTDVGRGWRTTFHSSSETLWLSLCVFVCMCVIDRHKMAAPMPSYKLTVLVLIQLSVLPND